MMTSNFIQWDFALEKLQNRWTNFFVLNFSWNHLLQQPCLHSSRIFAAVKTQVCFCSFLKAIICLIAWLFNWYWTFCLLEGTLPYSLSYKMLFLSCVTQKWEAQGSVKDCIFSQGWYRKGTCCAWSHGNTLVVFIICLLFIHYSLFIIH